MKLVLATFGNSVAGVGIWFLLFHAYSVIMPLDSDFLVGIAQTVCASPAYDRRAAVLSMRFKLSFLLLLA